MEITLTKHQLIFIKTVMKVINEKKELKEFISFRRTGKTFALNALDKILNENSKGVDWHEAMNVNPFLTDGKN